MAVPAPAEKRSDVYVAIGVTVILLIGSLLLKIATREAERYDFGQLYSAGRMLWEGHGARLYDLSFQQNMQEHLLGRPGVLPFISPPFEALFFVPLAILKYWQAYLLWGIFNIALWLGFVWTTRQMSRLPLYRHLIACFGFFPLWLALDLGQVTFVLLALVTLSFIAMRRGMDLQAGALLGLGLFRFQLLLPLLLLGLIQKRWRFLAGVSVSAAMYMALSIGVFGLNGVWSYSNLLLSVTGTLSDPTSWDMPTLRCFFTVMSSGNPLWTDALSIISAIALLGWLIVRQFHMSADEFFPLALMLSVLVAPYAHSYDLSFVLLAQLILARKEPFHPLQLLLFGYPLVVFLVAAYSERMRVLWPLLGVPLLVLASLKVLCRSQIGVRSDSRALPERVEII